MEKGVDGFYFLASCECYSIKEHENRCNIQIIYKLIVNWRRITLIFSESLLSLIERLSGPFNVEMTIDPLSIKISDAIMNFQEAGFQVIIVCFSQAKDKKSCRQIVILCNDANLLLRSSFFLF